MGQVSRGVVGLALVLVAAQVSLPYWLGDFRMDCPRGASRGDFSGWLWFAAGYLLLALGWWLHLPAPACPGWLRSLTGLAVVPVLGIWLLLGLASGHPVMAAIGLGGALPSALVLLLIAWQTVSTKRED